MGAHGEEQLRSRRYQLLPRGYSIGLVLLKFFERVYAPLVAGLLNPIKADANLEIRNRYLSVRLPICG